MSAESTNPNQAIRNRQFALIGGGVLLVALAAGALVFFVDSKPEAARAVAETNKLVKLQIAKPADVSDKEQWRSIQGNLNKKLQSELNELNKRNETLKSSFDAATKTQESTDKTLKEIRDELSNIKSRGPGIGPVNGSNNFTGVNSASAANANPSNRNPNLAGLNDPLPRIDQGAVLRRPGSINEPPTFKGGNVSLNGATGFNGLNNPGALAGSTNVGLAQNTRALPEVEIIRFSKPDDSETTTNGALNPSSSGESVPRNGSSNSRTKSGKGTFIPANTFVRVVQLNGVLAPVSGQGQGSAGNAHPIIFEVVDPANLPNFRKLNIKGCRFLAAATGDLSSERVYARTETFTCVKHDGEAVEMPVRGHVIGEDGNIGIAGTLISKAGRVIAAQIAAEFAKGVGNGFKAFATSQTSTAAGITQTIDPNRYGQAALGSGLAGGSDALASYYIKLSNQLFPVIETPGGRIVEIAVTSGVDFPGNLSQLDNVSFSDKRKAVFDHD